MPPSVRFRFDSSCHGAGAPVQDPLRRVPYAGGSATTCASSTHRPRRPLRTLPLLALIDSLRRVRVARPPLFEHDGPDSQHRHREGRAAEERLGTEGGLPSMQRRRCSGRSSAIQAPGHQPLIILPLFQLTAARHMAQRRSLTEGRINHREPRVNSPVCGVNEWGSASRLYSRLASYEMGVFVSSTLPRDDVP